MRVMTILGTRPEIIKLSRVIPELDKHFEHVLIHAGQNYDYELGGIFFDQMKIRRPDEWHTGPCHRTDAIHALAEMLSAIDNALSYNKPDAVLILGDTNSAVAAAYAAKRRHIPIFHMEAGNRCFDDRTPEEVNRRIVDHIADINLPYTEHARRNLLAEGIRPDRIIKTGSPMGEVVLHYAEDIVLAGLNTQIPVHDYVVSCHREENVDDPARLGVLVAVVNRLPGTVLFPVHPRTASRMSAAFRDGVTLVKPLGFAEYMHHQIKAKCVISDSGTLTEEASLLGFPAVTIRQTHERPEGDDEAAILRSDLEVEKVLAAVKAAAVLNCYPDDYEAEQVAAKVARTILSYTDVIKRQYA